MIEVNIDFKKKKLRELKDEVRDFHPLLNELLQKIPRVNRVEYTHGQYEKGADFVLVQPFPLSEPEPQFHNRSRLFLGEILNDETFIYRLFMMTESS